MCVWGGGGGGGAKTTTALNLALDFLAPYKSTMVEKSEQGYHNYEVCWRVTSINDTRSSLNNFSIGQFFKRVLNFHHYLKYMV